VSVNRIMGANSGLQCLLYTNFVIKGKYPVDSVAEKMGIHRDTLYKWIEGVNLFPADRLAPLVVATGDPEYLEYILDKCGYAVLPKIRDKKAAETMIQMAKVFMSATNGRGDLL